MEVVHPRVAGIDVHKKVIWVAVRLPGPGARHSATVTVRRFKVVLAVAAEDGRPGWRSWASTDAAMESDRGVLVAGLPCPGRRRVHRGVRVRCGAHA